MQALNSAASAMRPYPPPRTSFWTSFGIAGGPSRKQITVARRPEKDNCLGQQAGRGAAGEAVRLSRDLRFAAQRLHRRARASTRARRRCFSVAKAYSSTRAAISLHPKTNSLAAPFSGGSKDSIPICKPFSAARGSSRRLSLAAGKVPELFIAPWHTFWEV